MRDMFDEFLEELQRRQRGESPDAPADGSDDDDDDGQAHAAAPKPDEGRATPDARGDDRSPTDDDADEEPGGRPADIFTARRRTSESRSRPSSRGRGPGGPDD